MRSYRYRASVDLATVLLGLAAAPGSGAGWQQPGAPDYARIEKAIVEHRLGLAQQELEKELQTHPTDARAHMLLGIVFDGENRPSDAQREFQAALRLEPASASAHINLGKHYAQQQNLAGAVREFQSAIRLDPHNATAYENLGLVLMTQGQRAEALHQMEAAAELAPNEPPMMVTLFKAQLAAQKIPEARRTLARIEDLAPPNVNVDSALGAMQAAGGDFTGAIETLQRAQTREPNSTDILYNLGLAYYKSGDLPHAAQTLEGSRRLKDTGEVENLLGQVDEDNHQYVEAAQALQKAIQLEPKNESYRFDFTLELLKHRSFDAAIVSAEKDARDFPDSLRLWLILGVAYFGRGQYTKSINTLVETAQKFPEAETALFCLAQASGVTGERAEEVRSLVAAYAQSHPARAWPFYYLGQLAASQTEAGPDKLREAESLLKKSIALDPNYAESYYQLGNAHAKLGAWHEAADDYRKAVTLKPTLAEAHYRLAEADRKLGNTSAAQKEFAIHQSLMQQQSEQSLRDQDMQTFLYKLTQ